MNGHGFWCNQGAARSGVQLSDEQTRSEHVLDLRTTTHALVVLHLDVVMWMSLIQTQIEKDTTNTSKQVSRNGSYVGGRGPF